MIIGTSILIAVLLALAYCKLKNIKTIYVHGFLQVIGLIGLLGFRDPMIAVVYVVSLVTISSYKNRGSKELMTSPMYTAVLLASLFLFISTSNVFLYGAKTNNAVLAWLKSILPNHVILVLFAAFIVSILGELWINIWTNRHSIFTYITVLLCSLVALFCFIVYSAGQNFKLL